MTNVWNNCKKILCIRADNMGDVIMTTPALRALKETFGAHITLLTSSMAYPITPAIPVIDEVIVADLPWIKTKEIPRADEITALIETLRSKNFEAAVIFTVYSQSALPAALMAMQAGIGKRLAYSRENPYALLTDWLPDPEPYRFIQHQVERDLKLVNNVGAFTNDDHLLLHIDGTAIETVRYKLQEAGITAQAPFIILHPGVSEIKRQYPETYWIETGKCLTASNIPVLITGSPADYEQTQRVTSGIGSGAFNMAGVLNITEFIALISLATLVISVNTATVHIAAATQTPVLVLYALTNPQHTPWKVPAKLLYFSIEEPVRSRNEVVSWVHDQLYHEHVRLPLPTDIVAIAQELLLKRTTTMH